MSHFQTYPTPLLLWFMVVFNVATCVSVWLDITSRGLKGGELVRFTNTGEHLRWSAGQWFVERGFELLMTRRSDI
jgi:hypothetical protein